MRVLKNVGLGLAAGGFVLAGSGAAFAGAWDNVGVGSLDLLFAPEKFVVEAGATYADRNVDYDLTDSKAQGGGQVFLLDGPERVTPNIWDVRAGVKARLMDNLDCLGRWNTPYSINEEMDPEWEGRYGGYKTNATTLGLDATCAYKFQIDGASNLRAIAGVRALDLTYASDGSVLGFILGAGLLETEWAGDQNLIVPNPADDPDVDGDEFIPTAHAFKDYDTETSVKSKGMEWGWRAGIAYEIPAYALRASLVYDSEISLDLEGSSQVKDIPFTDGTLNARVSSAYASLTLPQSVELNVQSGIAPGWLATFGVKWVDWSVIDRLVLVGDDGEAITNRKLGFKDGWTVKAGIGHQFNEKLALGSSVQWDRGVGGSYSDNYTFAAGGAYALNDKVKVSLGGAAIYKTAGKGAAYDEAVPDGFPPHGYAYEYDASWNFAVDTKLRIAF